MITGDRILFERSLMFFIENDQAQPGNRRKQGTARTNDNLRGSTGNETPLMMPFNIAHVAMENRYLPETLHEAMASLGG